VGQERPFWSFCALYAEGSREVWGYSEGEGMYGLVFFGEVLRKPFFADELWILDRGKMMDRYS
jgi:hypothetical protein